MPYLFMYSGVEIVTAPSHTSAVRPDYESKFSSVLGDEKVTKSTTVEDGEVDSMQVDEKRRNPKTLLDEHGKYPAWMTQRSIKKQQQKRKSVAKTKARKQKQRR
jgi:hypothetical protein